MDITIDPEFAALCPPLTQEERATLEHSLTREGCRDPLLLWHEGAQYRMLDGHNRYAICLQHTLDFTTQVLPLANRAEAVNWIIANQLGRRNLTTEQKSYLRGKRYHAEKQQGARTDLTSHHFDAKLTRQRLAEEYKVGVSTIDRDGAFAEAVDTLEAHVRQDIRNAVLQRQDRVQGTMTKQQATRAGKLVQDQTVLPQPFMQREHWKPYHVLAAIDRLAAIPPDEHAAINRLLEGPFIPADDGLEILKNLAAMADEKRQHLYRLHASPEKREQDLALSLAAAKAPPPDPQSQLAEGLILALQQTQQRLRRNWINVYPHEAWSDALRDLEADLLRMMTRLTSIQTQVETAHNERMAPYGTTL